MSDYATIKPGAKPWTIKEQICRDPVSELTLQFDTLPDGSARLRIFGAALPFGNREIGFGKDGSWEWSGVAVAPCAVPASGWIKGKTPKEPVP